MMRDLLIVLGRWLLAAALSAFVLYNVLTYGFGTPNPDPFWWGLVSVPALVMAYRVWPRG